MSSAFRPLYESAPQEDVRQDADLLSELSRATTVYHEAEPDCLERAREDYEEALRKFNASPGTRMCRFV